MKNIYLLTISPLRADNSFISKDVKCFSSRKKALEMIQALFRMPEFSSFEDDFSFEDGRLIACKNGMRYFAKIEKKLLQ